MTRNKRELRAAGLGGRQQAARGTGGAVGVVVSVVERCARFLDVRAGIRPPALEKWREREQKLRDGKEKQRRTPQDSWQNAGMRHKGHTLESLVRSGGCNNGR